MLPINRNCTYQNNQTTVKHDGFIYGYASVAEVSSHNGNLVEDLCAVILDKKTNQIKTLEARKHTITLV